MSMMQEKQTFCAPAGFGLTGRLRGSVFWVRLTGLRVRLGLSALASSSSHRGDLMKVQSNLQPDEIYIDKIKNGRARLLCRWNIEEQSITDDNGETSTIYEYNEKVLWWTFPLEDESGLVLDNIDNISQYIQNNKLEILNFAKGAEVNL
jgi:hypothetical protein